VRFRDLLGLALSALFQQKVRTLLTTLGVVFGSFVLVASLAVRGGVRDTVEREYRRFGELRRIVVLPKYPPPAAVPETVMRITGSMSEARRRRLQRKKAEHWQRSHPSSSKVLLTPERVAALKRLDGVHAVEPVLIQQYHVFFGGKTQRTYGVTAPDDTRYRDRIIAGTFLPRAGTDCVVVSEYLLYELGVADDADLQGVVGKRLRVEYRPGRPLSLLLESPDQPAVTTVGEEEVLQKVLDRLQEAAAKLKLNKRERAVLLKLFERPEEGPATKGAPVAAELTVCGVLRLPEENEKDPLWGRPLPTPDLIVATSAAEEMFLKLPQNRAGGFERVSVEVERLEDVKAVSKRIEAMGLEAHSLAKFVEQEQFTYVLIFSAMTVIAMVSLLVAALGITNTMLMSVLERVREIGVMKAVGARDGHIQLIFLVEGALVGLVGGLLGLLLGWAASFPGDAWVRAMVEEGMELKLQESIFVFPWWLVLGTPTFACLVTTLAAYYPARRAARVNPITALRHE
jgi:putative ABC transport system permease protein